MSDMNEQTASSPTTGQVDWEARYKGLSKTFNERVGSLEAEVSRQSQEAARAAQLEKQLKEREAMVEQFTTQVEQLSRARDEATANSATLAKQFSRAQAIMQHPALLIHESKGLLRTDLEGEAFAKYLADFETTLSSTALENLQSKMTGASPASPIGRNAAPSNDELKKQAFVAFANGDIQKYDSLMDQIVKQIASN